MKLGNYPDVAKATVLSNGQNNKSVPKLIRLLMQRVLMLVSKKRLKHINLNLQLCPLPSGPLVLAALVFESKEKHEKFNG